MGTSSRDTQRKSREYDGSYPYEVEGIKAILRDVYRLTESCYLNGDIDATIILTDLKMALDSECLTPRMRQVVALYYFIGITLDEISVVLNLSNKSVPKSILVNAIERISAEMDYGYNQSTNARISALLPESNRFYKILNEIADGTRPIYKMDNDLTNAVVVYLAQIGDKKAQETVRQFKEGFVCIGDIQPSEGEYLALTWEQMRWDDRRISYVGDVYYDDRYVKTGFRSVPEIQEDSEGGGWKYHRIRLFAKRN